MKISLKWLNDFIDLADFSDRPEDLARRLTAAGIEVESFVAQGGHFGSVVVGEVLERGTHPNADRLTLCQVNVGDGQPRQIVCGAKNHQAGDKVVVALPGAVLPGDFAITVSKIRGVESQGMMCSETELGVASASEGIMILPPEAPVGMPFATYAGLDDVILELSVTPNRADCLSHYGLARELAALLGRPCRLPEVPEPVSGARSGQGSRMQVINGARDLCPRYAGRMVSGVRVGPSPEWLRRRLESVGLKSINNVVDITNYVMLELGQPLHAFDRRRLSGEAILVDRAVPGEKFQTLDGTELVLVGDELTIRDAASALALAGVIGGLKSGVSAETQDLFIESAHFVPSSVRRSARQHGVETDSAYRFSRGTDPEMVSLALRRACHLMAQLAGGQISDVEVDDYEKPIQKNPVHLDYGSLLERLGYDVTEKEVTVYLTRLGCQVNWTPDLRHWTVLPPLFRWDLEDPMDLVEEVARLHGYEKIPEALPPLVGEPAPHDSAFTAEETLTDLFRSTGYSQAVNYGFLSGAEQEEWLIGNEPYAVAAERWQRLGLSIGARAVALKNPLSDELSTMRVSLMPRLFLNLLHNYRHGLELGRLFELGPVVAADAQGDYQTGTRVACLAWGQTRGLWAASSAPLVLEIKSVLEQVLRRLLVLAWDVRQIPPGEAPPFLHPAQAGAVWVEGRPVGFLGALHPRLQESWKLRHPVAVCELDAAALWRGQPRVPKAQRVSRLPAVERDFAFIVPKAVTIAELRNEIRRHAGPYLQRIDVFDLYSGENTPAGCHSVGFRLTFQALDETLTDSLLAEWQAAILTALKRFHGAGAG